MNNKYSVRSTSMKRESTPLVSSAGAPAVFFGDLAWAKLWHIVDLSPKEIGWYGTVEQIGNDFLITDLFIPEQVVSAATTDIEPEAMGKLAHKLEAQGIDSSQLRYWGHSHVNMQVSPSKTDEDQIEEYLDHCDWFIRGIHNKRRESKIDVYDVGSNVIHQCVDNGVIAAELTPDQYKQLVAEISTNVKDRVVVPIHQYGNSGRYGHPHNRNPYYHNTFEDVYHGGILGQGTEIVNQSARLTFEPDAELEALMSDPFGVR